jgi:hypothetical protein
MFHIHIVRPGGESEDIDCEDWGDVTDSIDGIGYEMRNGTVSDITIWIEDD